MTTEKKEHRTPTDKKVDSNYQYPWEKNWRKNRDCKLIGHVVVNVKHAEAAIIDHHSGPVFPESTITEADIRQDIMGDAEHKYNIARNAFFNRLSYEPED